MKYLLAGAWLGFGASMTWLLADPSLMAFLLALAVLVVTAILTGLEHSFDPAILEASDYGASFDSTDVLPPRLPDSKDKDKDKDQTQCTSRNLSPWS